MSGDSVFYPSNRYRTHIGIGVALIFVLFVLPYGLLALIPDLGGTFLWIFLAANVVWLVPTYLLIPLYVRSIEYEFTERDLLVRRGILTRSESMVPYRMVTNVEVKRGPIARALGIATLKVQTAGYSQQSQAEATLNGLSNWQDVRQQILGLIHQHRAEDGASAPGPNATATLEGDDVTMLLREILAELRTLRPGRG
jgi:membrane protein YdbS with pleckstrin-like domain